MYSWVSDMSDERNSESCCAAILKAGRWVTETGGREGGEQCLLQKATSSTPCRWPARILEHDDADT
jgi:hypothetical protein